MARSEITIDLAAIRRNVLTLIRVLGGTQLWAVVKADGYGRRFQADHPTWIGLVPVGYGDGFRRDLSGTQVLVDGERRRVIGTVSMDSFAVELDREHVPGTPVTLIGDELLVEEHARAAGTINYELVCGLHPRPGRSSRVVVDV